MARATASLDGAIDVLLPGGLTPVSASGAAAMYKTRGFAERSAGHGSLLA